MRRIHELDCLRAFAIFAVMLLHFRPRHLPFFDFMKVGWAGVDLFFVISGFLITGILLRLRQHPTPFREFYWRRTLRIFPPYYLVLLFIFLAATMRGENIAGQGYLAACFFGSSVTERLPLHLMLRRLLLQAGYNISPVFIDHHYFVLLHSGLWVFWSLSVEELFYLLWAPIVLKGSMRLILICSLTPLLVCPALRGLALTASNFALIAQSFITRFDTLAVGACLALLFVAVEAGRLPDRLVNRASLVAIPVSGVALALLSLRCGLLQNMEIRATLGFNLFGYSLLALFFASLVAVSVRYSDQKLTRLLRVRALVFVGSISYMLYLIHIPVYVAIGIVLRRM
jgi:peptidoglycan/LPS O-acetylase OafA/YrhL